MSQALKLQTRTSNYGWSSQASPADLCNVEDMNKRDILPRSDGGVCRNRPPQDKDHPGTDTGGGRTSTTQNNPCLPPFHFYVSCGGPEIIYPNSLAPYLEGVANCVKGPFDFVVHDRSNPLLIIGCPSNCIFHTPAHIF